MSLMAGSCRLQSRALAYDEALAGHYVLATSMKVEIANAAEVLAAHRLSSWGHIQLAIDRPAPLSTRLPNRFRAEGAAVILGKRNGIQRPAIFRTLWHLPWLIAAALLLASVVLKVAVDVIWQGGDNDWPLWSLLWAEGGVIEVATWMTLGTCALMAMWLSGRTHGDEARYWGWFGVGTALLLIEDAGNTSHRFAFYLDIVASRFGLAQPGVDAGRLVVYAALGSVMLWVLIGYRGIWWNQPRLRSPLMIGYALYGIAALMSVPLNLFFGGYERIGPRVIEFLYRGKLQPLPRPVPGFDDVSTSTGFVWMDTVFEESLELFAAALLLTVSVRGLLVVGAPISPKSANGDAQDETAHPDCT